MARRRCLCCLSAKAKADENGGHAAALDARVADDKPKREGEAAAHEGYKRGSQSTAHRHPSSGRIKNESNQTTPPPTVKTAASPRRGGSADASISSTRSKNNKPSKQPRVTSSTSCVRKNKKLFLVTKFVLAITLALGVSFALFADPPTKKTTRAAFAQYLSDSKEYVVAKSRDAQEKMRKLSQDGLYRVFKSTFPDLGQRTLFLLGNMAEEIKVRVARTIEAAKAVIGASSRR
ncbi:unnamed protein product [Amoebophrya sp. A120]|nr:unnamed protein product [Amoebophrya sp. A120]|eukprot:GSA120T00018307001.1